MSETPQTTTPEVTQREHFIPLRKSDLVQILADDASLEPGERAHFLKLCRILEATFHFDYHTRLEELKDSYAPFDPDADTRPGGSPAPQSDDQARSFFEQFASLVKQANFRLLSREQLEDAMEAANDWGMKLHVDFDKFDRLEVFVRSEIMSHRQRRSLRTLYRRKEIEVPIYQRLVVVFRFSDRPDNSNDPNTIFMKIFKNIPKTDLEMLLPGTQVRMTLLDRFRILLPTVTGLGMIIFKIIRGAIVLAVVGISSLLAFLGLVAGTIGYGIKSFFGYLHTKDKYQSNLTKNLYYQNLDNNAGVLFRLLDEAEEQEFREAILGYSLLRRRAPDAGWTMEELDTEAEAFLLAAIDVDVDFEVDDALEKLQRLGLTKSLPGQRYAAIGIDEALVKLDEAWDSFFPYNNTQQ